jgi:hypothetical protein
MPNSVKTYRILYADTSRTVKADFIEYTGDGKFIILLDGRRQTKHVIVTANVVGVIEE